MINKNSRIFVAGHKGMIGSAVLRKLKKLKYKNIFFASKKQLNLTDQKKVSNYLKRIKPHAVILAAAKVGGIKVNNEKKANFIFENLEYELNVLTIKDPCQKENFPMQVNKDYFCKNNKLDTDQVFTIDGDLVIGLLHNASECTNEQIASIASNEMTGAMCEIRNNQPIEEVEGGMGDIFIQMAN